MTTISGTRANGGRAERGIPSADRFLLDELLGVVRQHLGMEVAFVSRIAQGRRVFEFVDSSPDFAPIQVGEGDAVEDTYCGRVVEGRLPGLVMDAGAEPVVADIPATRQIPIGTHLSVPVHADGEVYGTLCCFSRHVVDEVTPRDLATMRMFAAIVGTHLRPLAERARGVVEETRLVQQVLDQGGPVIALQPIIELATGTVYGYEALSRFPARDGWGPQEWFDAAERVGLGVTLESAAVRNALQHLTRLPAGACLAVNVSARAVLAGPDIVDQFAAGYGHRLVLEVTEHERIPDPRGLRERLAVTRAAGVRVAVDDAGSGFAGLAHILALDPEVLKLDRSLIHGIASDPGRQAMCQAMVTFCRETTATLVAEGVEDPDDLETLRALGVTHAQGYLLGRPSTWP